MKLLTALGVSIAILAAILIFIEWGLGLIGFQPIAITSWVCFVAWACFYAAGGKKEGLLKTLAANTAGAIVGFLIILLMGLLGFLGHPTALAIAVLVGAFVLVVQANWSVLSFIPAAFAGCASAFGSGGAGDFQLLIMCILSLWVGALFGIASEIWGNAMAKKDPPAAE